MTRYFLTPDGEAGAAIDAPTEAEYREAERESEGDAWTGDPPA